MRITIGVCGIVYGIIMITSEGGLVGVSGGRRGARLDVRAAGLLFSLSFIIIMQGEFYSRNEDVRVGLAAFAYP
jgi:hypothetical protein